MSDHNIKPRFLLWKFSAIVAAIWFFLAMGLGVFLMVNGRNSPDGLNTSYLAGRITGKAIAPFIIAYVIGWIAYRLGRRSNRVGNVVFLIIFIATMLDALALGLGTLQRMRKDREAQNNLLTSIDSMREKLRKQNASEDGLNTTSTLEVLNELESNAGKFSDQQGIGGKMSRIMARVARDSKGLAQTNAQIIEKIQTLGDMTNIKTKEDIEARIKLYGELRDSSKAMITYYDEIPTRLKTYLDDEKVPASEQAGFMKGMNESRGSTEEHTAYQNTIVKFSEDSAALYQYLLDHWGKWKFQGDEILFDAEIEDAAHTEYNKLLEEQEASLDAMVKSEEDWNSKVLKK